MNRLSLLGVVVLAGCSSSPDNVAGDYTVDVTDEANGCNLMSWNQGSSSSGIPVDVTQSNDQATAVITGIVGTYVKAVLGSATFTGSVDGSSFTGTLFGTTSATSGGCEYTYNAVLDATLDGDTLSGTIAYTPKTNGSPDCSTIEGCKSVQNFNGTRPPM